jgi:hypothetical protein
LGEYAAFALSCAHPPPDDAELPAPSATEAQKPETPRAKPSSIVTEKPGKKPYIGPPARDDDIDEAALERARAVDLPAPWKTPTSR